MSIVTAPSNGVADFGKIMEEEISSESAMAVIRD